MIWGLCSWKIFFKVMNVGKFPKPRTFRPKIFIVVGGTRHQPMQWFLHCCFFFLYRCHHYFILVHFKIYCVLIWVALWWIFNSSILTFGASLFDFISWSFWYHRPNSSTALYIWIPSLPFLPFPCGLGWFVFDSLSTTPSSSELIWVTLGY